MEITTSFFTIDEDGFLIVNQPDLDRDPPSTDKLGFQVFAREIDGELAERKTSSPVSIIILLRDINDNSPVLSTLSDIVISAGNTRRVVTTLNATDNDSNQQLEYRLLNISGSGVSSGRPKFAVNSRNGQVSVIAPVRKGEHYSLTVAAFDEGGKFSRAVMEITIGPSPNLRGPVFNQFLYEVTLPENAPKFTKVVQVKAKDPEDAGPVKFAIAQGDPDELFEIEEATGTIRVMKELDRESTDKHVLVRLKS